MADVRAEAVRPVVSIVVEAYNEEANALAPVEETYNALLKQDFPLEDVEVIVVASECQIEAWRGQYDHLPRVQRLRMLAIAAEESHYWRQKNLGVQAAEGEIVALIDCDVVPSPQWLSSGVNAIRGGADGSVGPSLYRNGDLGPDSAWMLAAALPSWSFALAFSSSSDRPAASALLAHNLIIRRDWLLRCPFPQDRRSFGSSIVYFKLTRAGAKLAYQPGQRTAHAVNLQWWCTRMHFRRGWETHHAQNADPSFPRLWLHRVRWIEPVALRMGLVLRDAWHWFRFTRILGVSWTRRILLWPLAISASLVARSAEMAGMYAALIAPAASEHQARF